MIPVVEHPYRRGGSRRSQVPVRLGWVGWVRDDKGTTFPGDKKIILLRSFVCFNRLTEWVWSHAGAMILNLWRLASRDWSVNILKESKYIDNNYIKTAKYWCTMCVYRVMSLRNRKNFHFYPLKTANSYNSRFLREWITSGDSHTELM